MWPDFGEYHMARLRAVAQYTPEVEAVGVETVGGYGTEQNLPFRSGHRDGITINTLFPESDYISLSESEIKLAVYRCLEAMRPSVVAICGYVFPESHAAIAWCRQNGKAVILMSDSQESDYERVWWKEAVKHRIVANCDAALVAARPQADYVIRLGMAAERIFMGYDVVDNSHFDTGARLARQQESDVRNELRLDLPFILTVARFIREKNLIKAMQAYSRYRSQLRNEAWAWVLCGDGLLKENIQKLRKDLALDGSVKLAGWVAYEKLPALYGLAECFWLPSMKDCYPLSLCEAMAAGAPVAVSERCGNASTLVEKGGNGWTCDPTSVDGMAQMLVRMHGLTEERRAAMGRRSQEIISNWGLDRFAEGLWNAVQAATEHAKRRKRGLSLLDRLILRV